MRRPRAGSALHLGQWTGPAHATAPPPWGPPAPLDRLLTFHLTLSASLTESTPIRGKRLFPHPPTHSHSLSLPTQPPGSTGDCSQVPSTRLSLTTLPSVRPVSVSASLSVAGGPSVPPGHLAAGGGLCPLQEGTAPSTPTQSPGSQVSDHRSVRSPCLSAAVVLPICEMSVQGDLLFPQLFFIWTVQPEEAEMGNLKGQPPGATPEDRLE